MGESTPQVKHSNAIREEGVRYNTSSDYDLVCWSGVCSGMSMQGESTNGPG